MPFASWKWWSRAVSFAVALSLALALGSTARAQDVASGAQGDRQAPVHLRVWNRHITSFRVPFESWSPEERARRAVGRILAVPARAEAWDIAYQEGELGPYKGYVFTIDGELAFRLLDRALSDFYVEYQLHVHLARAEERFLAQSRLHAEIQDTFNEHGVQIMSPHFRGQPAQAVVVPKARWFTAPASEAHAAGAKDVPSAPAGRSGPP